MTASGAPLRWLVELLQRPPQEGCIDDWPFSRNPDGRPRIYRSTPRRRVVHASVVLLQLAGRPQPPPPDHWALHSCDNPACLNLAHLRWGSGADNAADRVERGQQATGERNGCAKLTRLSVDEIRAAYAAGGISQEALGHIYGVSQGHICDIVHNRLWKDAK